MMEKILALQAQVAELVQWREETRNALGLPIIMRLGDSALTDTISIGAGGGSANVPKAYIDTFYIVQDGYQYEVPILTKTPS